MHAATLAKRYAREATVLTLQRFNLLTNYVTALESARRQHHRRQTQCLKTLRARRASQKTRSVEGGRARLRPSQNKAGSLSEMRNSRAALSSPRTLHWDNGFAWF